jgi:hypothetical protein
MFKHHFAELGMTPGACPGEQRKGTSDRARAVIVGGGVTGCSTPTTWRTWVD